MINHRAPAPVVDGVGLLERAINYTLGSLHLVTPGTLVQATPCRDWDLATLLRHVNDSLAALHDALDLGQLDPYADYGDPEMELVATARTRATRLLGASFGPAGHDLVAIADRAVTANIVSATGSIEIAVHGWDIAQSCGQNRSIPASLAREMLNLTSLFVTEADRPARFASPVAVRPSATPSDHLVAYLGRHPAVPAR